MSKVEKLAYTVDETCEALNLSRANLYSIWKRGAGPQFIHVGAKRLITRKAIDTYLASLEAQASATV
jgi:excisionase family DNA binding protein